MQAIDICNLALSYLGNTRAIKSMSEQSTEATLCSRFYEVVRKSLLKLYPWNFALHTADLTEKTTETHDEFSFVYAYPDDCLRVLRIGFENDGGNAVNDFNVIYTLDSGVSVRRIVTNVEAARATYIIDLQDTEAYPVEFSDALALMLAVRIALPLSSSGQLTQAVQNQAQIAVDLAKRMCAIERNQPPIKESRYISARR